MEFSATRKQDVAVCLLPLWNAEASSVENGGLRWKQQLVQEAAGETVGRVPTVEQSADRGQATRPIENGSYIDASDMTVVLMIPASGAWSPTVCITTFKFVLLGNSLTKTAF